MSERDWLRRLEGRPRKSLGQHFLIDPHAIERLVRRAEIPRDARLLEIGAGAGALTFPLLASGRRVVAVEKDARLCSLLRERAAAAGIDALTVIEADIRDLELGRPPLDGRSDSRWIVLGNLPYLITTPILEWTIRFKTLLAWALFMVQREYGERLLAAPATPAYGSLTVWIGYHFSSRKELEVGPTSFWPPPKIASTVVRLVPHETPPVEVPSAEALERVVRAAFSQRRKMLLGALAGGLGLPRPEVSRILERAGVDGRKRAEQCGLAEFAALSRSLSASDLLPGTR